MSTTQLTGRIAADRVRMMTVPVQPREVIDAFLALGDPVGLVADSMDELGVAGSVIGTHILRPTMPERCIVGPALTLRNIARRGDPHAISLTKVNKMAEFEAHNLASEGDVLVIQGVPGVSNMGGISAQTAKRQGEVGAIVWGGVRDVAHSREVDYPVWATEFTAVTGKWRIETMEINGPVQIAHARVEPGDLVVADETSVCFIPRDDIAAVLALAQKKAEAEKVRCAAIDDGVPVRDLINSSYGEKKT